LKQIQTDLAIVSAGTAGLAAAVAAAEKGIKVAAFEKAATTGGTGNMGMGPFAVGSRQQKIMNVALGTEDAFRIFMEYTHYRVDGRLVSEYINKSANTIQWLEDMGVVFLEVLAYARGSQFTQHVAAGASGHAGPQSSAMIMKAMTERARELGVKFYLNTPVKKILKEGGRITGLMAQGQDGEEIQANAKAVIIATGGFGDSPELIKKYTGYEWGKDIFNYRIPGLVGDGIRMAWEVGAGQEGLNMELTCGVPQKSIEDTQKSIMAGQVSILALFRQPGLMVNVFGERFMDEASGNPTFLGNAVSRQPKHCAFKIFDSSLLKYYEENGLDFLSSLTPDPKIENILEKAEASAKYNDHVFVADSLDGLAEKTGIDVAGLKKTIEEYNGMCSTGRDPIFHKKAEFLRPIKQPKYVAGRMFPAGYGSLGGIKINHRMEVVNQEQEPITGLYAAGVDSTSIFADSYPFVFPGNTMGFALNGGRMAGENAAAYIRKQK
jgi:fumarate reductase flavoprotein subunit